MTLTSTYPYAGAFLIGLSKAGFATGLGMLTTPLLATAMSAREALGVVLPLLCVADLFTISLYWKKWDFSLVKFPLAGVVLGTAIGMFFVNTISDHGLKFSIGLTGLVLVVLLIVRNIWYPEKTYRPSWWQGVVVGIAAGFTSTISHGAGPIIAIFLIAQKPDKIVFVASSAIYFTLGNLVKVPPYLVAGVINKETLLKDLYLLPLIPIGVGLGYLMNRYLPQKWFGVLVYALLLITSLDLLIRS